MHVGFLIESRVVCADGGGYWFDVEEEQTIEPWDGAGPGWPG